MPSVQNACFTPQNLQFVVQRNTQKQPFSRHFANTFLVIRKVSITFPIVVYQKRAFWIFQFSLISHKFLQKARFWSCSFTVQFVLRSFGIASVRLVAPMKIIH